VGTWAATSGRSLDQARREDVEAWIGALPARWKPSTAHNRYRGLHAFYRWLEEEEDVPRPMAKMKPPAAPDVPIPILGEPQLRVLFAVCAGKDFDARRDTALLMTLLDAGPRRAELLGMRLQDLNFEYDVVRVVGKGARERALPFGRKTTLALDRYLRTRSRHRLAHLDALWLGQRWPLTSSARACRSIACSTSGGCRRQGAANTACRRAAWVARRRWRPAWRSNPTSSGRVSLAASAGVGAAASRTRASGRMIPPRVVRNAVSNPG
jgi:integrase